MTFQQSPKRQPSRKARQRVRDAFNPTALSYFCTTWDFSDYADYVELPGKERFYYYVDNGSDILGVAHLDSVQAIGVASIMDTTAGPVVFSGTLDDRLGVYVLLDLLPKLGITTDWLLTTDEEIGQSTAEDFETLKSYNWLYQFDRAGTDVVLYDYETPELCELVEKSGARVGNGSFSDICYLEHLGCAGFNWGVGYQDYHGPRSHAFLEDTFRSVARFVKFHNVNRDKYLSHTPLPKQDWRAVAKWWEESTLTVSDCGHAVDLDDSTSFVESLGGSLITCRDCGTIPDVAS